MILLKQARLDKHLTIDELASKTGISSRTIHRLEAEPGAGAWDSTIIKLAEYLQVKPSELLQPVGVERQESAA